MKENLYVILGISCVFLMACIIVTLPSNDDAAVYSTNKTNTQVSHDVHQLFKAAYYKPSEKTINDLESYIYDVANHGSLKHIQASRIALFVVSCELGIVPENTKPESY